MIVKIESTLCVTLPDDYRSFLMLVQITNVIGDTTVAADADDTVQIYLEAQEMQMTTDQDSWYQQATLEITQAADAYTFDEADKDKVLHQFTTAAGLLGMLSDKTIHATNFRFLNDRSEGTFGAEVVLDVIDESAHPSGLADPHGLLPMVRTEASEHLNYMDNYIACFSEKSDHHGQWMLYGDRCRGYAVGFRADTLSKTTLAHSSGDTGQRLVRVIYEPDRQREVVKSLLRTAINLVHKAQQVKPAIDVNSILQSVCTMLVIEFGFASLAMKDPRFSDEQEWRICCKTTQGTEDEILFRPGMYGVTPYMRLSVGGRSDKKFPISTLRAGPALDQTGFQWVANLMKRRCILSGEATTETSTVPHRVGG